MYSQRLVRPVFRVAARPWPQRATVGGERYFLRRNRPTGQEPADHLNIEQLSKRRQYYDRDRTAFLVAGLISCIIGLVYSTYKLKGSMEDRAARKKKKKEAMIGAAKLDSSVPNEMFTMEGGTKRKVVVHDADGHEIVPTGNKTAPTFPRTIDLAVGAPVSKDSGPIETMVQDKTGTEYTLVGLGLRTVSFLSIQVYVVGFYVATSDVATLQNYLIKKINPLATTLVPSEREELRKALLDPADGEKTWDGILKESGCRSAFRIVPVRDTDFHHLRDGFMRAIAHRSKGNEAFSDDQFGQAMRDLKAMFNRGKAPKNHELLLCRGASGQLTATYDGGKGWRGRTEIGSVDDERVSRLLWLNYLAGRNVASEAARQNIILGVMEFVERPIGTVAAQVV